LEEYKDYFNLEPPSNDINVINQQTEQTEQSKKKKYTLNSQLIRIFWNSWILGEEMDKYEMFTEEDKILI
jgi:hypothetical protein